MLLSTISFISVHRRKKSTHLYDRLLKTVKLKLLPYCYPFWRYLIFVIFAIAKKKAKKSREKMLSQKLTTRNIIACYKSVASLKGEFCTLGSEIWLYICEFMMLTNTTEKRNLRMLQ